MDPSSTPAIVHSFTISEPLLDNVVLAVNPRTNINVIAAFFPFESVKLVSAVAKVTFRPGTAGDSVILGILPTTTAANAANTTNAQLVDIAYFSTTDGNSITVALPPDHWFGKQIKGTNLGNAAPQFCVAPFVAGAAGAQVGRLIVRFVVECTGCSA